MFDIREVASDFSAAAAQYDRHATLQRQVMRQLMQKMAALLPSSGSVLDAGCGTGGLAAELKGHAITQLDLAPGMCRVAAGNAMQTVNGSLASLPFADAVFDGVFSSLVIQWTSDWRQAVQEMRRVLKPRGVLAVATFGPDTLGELKESFAVSDRYAHVSSFIAREEFEHSHKITEYFPDLISIMRRLKLIGARNKLLWRRKSLMTPRQLQRVSRRYEERFGNASGLPVTWEILHSVTQS